MRFKGNIILVQLFFTSNLLLMNTSGQSISDFFKNENNPLSKGKLANWKTNVKFEKQTIGVN